MKLKPHYFFPIFIIVSFVTNAVLNSAIELSFDEAYYWIYSEYLAWGYFDHPPMVAIFIKLGTLIFGNTEFGVRLFFNLSMCASSFLIYILAGREKPIIVISLLMSMPLLMFSGLFALPDTPLLLFSLLFLLSLKRYLQKDDLLNCLFVSLSIAGMFYSKYHGLLIILLTLIAHPAFFRKKSFWFCIALVLAFYMPHMYWQYKHDFISFKFHLTGRAEKHFELANIVSYISGQFALMGMTIAPIFLLKIKTLNKTKPFDRILLFNSVGFLVFLLFISFRNQIEANWTISCAAVFVILFASTMKPGKRFASLVIVPILLVLISKLALYQSEYIVDNLKLIDSRMNEISFWKNIRIPAILEICGKNKIVADSYQVAAKLSFYTGQKIPALHLSSRSSHYELLNISEGFRTGKFCFLTSAALLPSVRIETNFKDPIYIVKETTLTQLSAVYK